MTAALLVPIFSALAHEVTVEVAGDSHELRPGVTEVPQLVADQVVGADNSGGSLSGRGFRRLYYDEPARSAEAIVEAHRDHVRFLARHQAPEHALEAARELLAVAEAEAVLLLAAPEPAEPQVETPAVTDPAVDTIETPNAEEPPPSEPTTPADEPAPETPQEPEPAQPQVETPAEEPQPPPEG